MQSLRLLKLKNIKLTGSYHHLSKDLRWLCWHGFPLKVIPDDFDQPNLVAIDLSYSKLIRVWEDTDVLLKNLKIINLSHSHYLTESPDFSKVPNLEELILANCRKLSQIHPSIGQLERLSLINLEDCKMLQYFPGDFYKSKSVKTLILNGCSRFRILTDSLGEMVSLTTLKANHTMISQGPSSIVRLKNLVSLFLWGLRGSPSSNLLRPSMTFLGLGNCNLTDDSIPKDLGSLFSLEILELDGNLFYSLPSLSGLSKLKMLDLSYCENLLEIPDLPRSLEILKANHCIALAKLPNFSEMSSMVELHLNHSPKLTEILGLHKSLNSMRRIHMEGCTNLTADFRKNILQGWTSCGHGDIFLNGIYDIPEGFLFVGTHESNDVRFKVPRIIGRNFRGLTVCCIFETYCPGFIVTNVANGKALHIWEESTCWVADSVLRLQSVLSNDVLHLRSGDEVSISEVTEALGRGMVMKTGVNLVWDDGDGGDAYSSNDENGAIPSNTSYEETPPSPSVHTDRCPPMASDLKKRDKEAFIYDPFELAAASVKPKYRHEFYQKPEEVVVTIFAEGIPANDVKVDFGEQILSVSIDVAGEDAYYFQARLFGKIIPEKCRFEVLSTKVEIRLAKAEPLQWISLEFSKDSPVPPRVSGPAVGASRLPMRRGQIKRRILDQLLETLARAKGRNNQEFDKK